jgi:hypothetical protein
MNRVHAILRASVLVLASLYLCACHKINPVPPETPAPLQPAGREFVYAFDNDASGKIAARFHGALTGSGANSEWLVNADPTAPSPPNVLAQMSADDTGHRFPLAVNDEKLYEVEDETFKDAGKVGLWTKADSVTYFDDLRVIAR